MVALFVFTLSYGIITIIDKIMPFRASDDEQLEGLDVSECGIESYPEFRQNI